MLEEITIFSLLFRLLQTMKKDAARIARSIPRCKHHHKDCIREVAEISYEDFLKIEHENDNDPYLKCSCIQEQRSIDLSERIVHEKKLDAEPKEESTRCVYFGKTKVKHPKKYFRFNTQPAMVLDY